MTEQNKEQASLFEALSKFQGDMKPLELTASVSVRTTSGGEYKFKYATLASIVEKIAQPMKANGLSFTQWIEDAQVYTIIFHSGGGSIKSVIPFPIPEGKTDRDGTVRPFTAQEVGSWITYFRRYGLVTALGLAADDDEDGNVASGNTYTKTAVKKEKYSNTHPKEVVPENSLKPCDRCGGRFILKEGKFGTFYSCSSYPKCKRTLKLEEAEMWTSTATMDTEVPPPPEPPAFTD